MQRREREKLVETQQPREREEEEEEEKKDTRQNVVQQ